MEITICDLCRKQPSEDTLNHWVEIAYSKEGMLAKFGSRVRKEICGECFSKLNDFFKS